MKCYAAAQRLNKSTRRNNKSIPHLKAENYHFIILYVDSLKRNGYYFASAKLMWVYMHTPLHKSILLAQTQLHIQTWIEGSTEQK